MARKRSTQGLLLLSLLLPPAAAEAAEAVLGVEGETGYNSNLFYQSSDIQTDGTVRLGPSFELRDRRGKLTWSVVYRPSYEAYFTTRGINAVYHRLNGEVSWQPSQTTEIYANEAFSDTPVRSSVLQTDEAQLLATPGPSFRNSDVIQSFFDGGVRHFFSPRWVGELGFSNGLLRYQDSIFTDSAATTGQGFLTYGWTPSDRIGTGFAATRQTFSQSGGSSGGSTYYQAFGIWNHDFSPTLSLRVNAGPTLVQPDRTDFETTRQGVPLFGRREATRDGTVVNPIDASGCVPFQGVLVAEACPVIAIDAANVLAVDDTGEPVDLSQTGNLSLLGASPKTAGSSITYFANVSLQKRWRWFEASASYVRNASNTSGFGQSLITDTVTLATIWDPSPVWRLTLTGLFTRRQSSSDSAFLLTPVQPVDFCVLSPDSGAACSNAAGTFFPAVSFQGAQAAGLRTFSQNAGFEIVNYAFTAQLNRQIGNNAYVFGRASFEQQTNKVKGFDSVDFDRYLITIGFRYEFDAFHL